MEKISVIIPVYNAATWVGLTIDNILKQSYRQIELILVDDASTDGSDLICQQYAAQDQRVIYIKQASNGGVSQARNIALDRSTGAWLFFIDSDDLLDNDGLSKLIAYAHQYQVSVVEAKRCIWWYHHQQWKTFNEIYRVRKNKRLNKNGIMVKPRYVTGKLYRRDVIGNVRFNEKIRCYEDTLFNHQIKTQIHGYLMVADVRYHYIQHTSSLMNIIGPHHLIYPYVAKQIRMIYQHSSLQQYQRIVNRKINDDIIVLTSKLPYSQLDFHQQVKTTLELLSLIQNPTGLQWLVAFILKRRWLYWLYEKIFCNVPVSKISFVFLSWFYADNCEDQHVCDIVKQLEQKYLYKDKAF